MDILKTFIKSLFGFFNLEISRKNNKWYKGGSLIQTSYESDREFHKFYDISQRKTGMVETDNPLRRMRHYTLTKILRYAPLDQGYVVELGCWKGLSTYQIASYLREVNYNLEFFVFDSFEGLSDLLEIDIAKDRKIDKEKIKTQFRCSLNEVKNNLIEFQFIKYFKGWIPKKFHNVNNYKFSFVHIDVDLYQPIKDSIDFFFPRLCKNGIMIFDDYGCTQFPGAKLAIDEFIESRGGIVFLPLQSGQAILIKIQ